MNKERRKAIAAIIEELQAFEELKSNLQERVTELRDAEEEGFENLSEGFQQSERGQTMEAAKDNLEYAADGLDGFDVGEVIAYLEAASE